MPAAAPTIDRRLLDALPRLDTGACSIADVHRAIGSLADGLGLTRPSYEQVRVLVNEIRAHSASRRRDPDEPSTVELLRDVAFRVRPVSVLNDRLEGLPVRKLR